MALSINRVTLVGRIGRDPEVRTTPSGHKVANLSVATQSRWTDKSGARQERTTWHKATAWSQLAEIAERVLTKGSLCYLDGELIYSEYTDKDGVVRQKAEVRLDQIVALGAGKDREAGPRGTPVYADPVTVREPGWGDNDEPPF